MYVYELKANLCSYFNKHCRIKVSSLKARPKGSMGSSLFIFRGTTGKMESNKPFLDLNDFVSENRKCLLRQNTIPFQYTHRVQFLTVSFRVVQALSL